MFQVQELMVDARLPSSRTIAAHDTSGPLLHPDEDYERITAVKKESANDGSVSQR
jgi:hypothetical protein